MGASKFVSANYLGASVLDLENNYPETLGGPTDLKNKDNGDELSQGDVVSADFPAVVDTQINDLSLNSLSRESVLSSPNPLSGALPSRNGLIIYKVKSGDKLSSIAAQFAISLNTIIWANSSIYKNFLRPGQELVILPVSGVLHQVESGETFESIANLYSVDVASIRSVNSGSSVSLEALEKLVIPGGKPIVNQKNITNVNQNLPSLSGYFKIPTTGWNWGQLHAYNAVDIADSCGVPVYSAADGLVVESRNTGFNSGYGYFIKIEHPNDTATLYAHLERTIVDSGDLVKQSQLIGYIGNTGNTHGPTGCHLHFEVHGAKNPFAKY